MPADHEIKWLRFPGGSTNTVSHRYGGSDIMKKLKADAESRGFTYVDWNVCAEDSLGGHPSASTIYNNIIREVGDKNTCVVLMHDTNATKNTARCRMLSAGSKMQATDSRPWTIWKKSRNRRRRPACCGQNTAGI